MNFAVVEKACEYFEKTKDKTLKKCNYTHNPNYSKKSYYDNNKIYLNVNNGLILPHKNSNTPAFSVDEDLLTKDLEKFSKLLKRIYKYEDFNTYAAVFAEYCMLCYIYGIIDIKNYELVVLDAFVNTSQEEHQYFFECIGKGIFSFGKSEDNGSPYKSSLIYFEKAESIISNIDVVNLFRFILILQEKIIKGNSLEKNLDDIACIYNRLSAEMKKRLIQTDSPFPQSVCLPYVCVDVIVEKDEYNNRCHKTTDSFNERCFTCLYPIVLTSETTKYILISLLDYFTQLKKSNEKLITLQKERENLIDYHAHSWKHISFPSIVHDVAQRLLNQGDKDNANKLFRAYNSENLLANDLNLLKIMYSSSNAELMGKFKDSFIDPDVCDPYVKTLEEVMYEALDLVVFRTVMEDVDKRNELSEIKSSLDDRLSVLRESYTTEILGQDNNGSNKIKEWFCRYMYSLKVNASDLWTYIKLSTKGNNTAYIILSDMFINVFTNIMKYGEKSTENGSLEITVDDFEINSLYFMKFSFTNPIAANSSKYPGNGVGINSIRNCLEKINSACEEFASDVVSVQVEKSDRLYTINIFVCEKAISTM